MKRNYKVKKNYYELKELFKYLKEKNRFLEKDNERFEDVPKELSDMDKIGRVFHNSYMDFYKNVKFNSDDNDAVIPAGLTSNNKNYL